jgi:DNA-binding response OmpR family regulator
VNARGSGGVLLLVEDDDSIGRLVKQYLEQQDGWRVVWLRSGEDAINELRRHPIRLVVLDIGLPGIDGFEVCRRIRAGSKVPIIMLTARDEEPDRVAGLELGADDYVAKPFSPKELVARVRAVLRRSRPGETLRSLAVGGVSLDTARHVVTVDGRPVELTPKEFDLLHALLESAGRVLSREHLLNRVWGYARADEIESRTVDVHIRRLRSKLGAEEQRIATIKGVGYRFEND